MRKWWDDHSQTIVGLAVGGSLVTFANIYWPDGGNAYDTVAGIGVILLGIGTQGVIAMFFREVAKPEDPV